jgi:transposase
LPSAALGFVCVAPALPEGPCPVCPRLAAEFEPYRQAAYWKVMHERAVAREAQLQAEIEVLRAQLRLREQQLFGRKSEAGAGASEAVVTPKPTRPRGQQPGKPGPSRRDHSHLPVVEEILDIPASEQCCSCCGLPLEVFPGTEDSDVLEVEVQAYRRVLRRRRYRPRCACGKHPGIVTAAPAPKVIPKSTLGISIWVEVLLDKYLFYRPTYRLLAGWRTLGLDLALGTLTDGLQRLLPLFEPVYQALVAHNQQQKHWHADETRWLVFATVEGKVGHRWYLWVFHSEQVVVFVLDPGRSHQVPQEHLGPVREGILSVDRYAAYQAMQPVKDGLIVLAYCWAHVRRDFLEMARSWPTQEEWALGWVARIGQLYQANNARLEVLDQPKAFAAQDGQLRQYVAALAAQASKELAEPNIHPARQAVLTSLQGHWDGLTVFVDHPEVPLDNNTAERAERGPVVLRKNSYGSGSVWSGRLATILFSLLQTLCLWNINPRAWLGAYLQACAEAGGQAPPALTSLLPWNLSEQRRQEWALEPQSDNSS